MIQFRPALSSKANDSDEYYGDDDDGDGGHDPHPHSPQVPCSRVPNAQRVQVLLWTVCGPVCPRGHIRPITHLGFLL